MEGDISDHRARATSNANPPMEDAGASAAPSSVTAGGGDSAAIGAVAIGRNEGARLTACLDSLCDLTQRIVYVDSGSTDDSVVNAETRGAIVVSLDMAAPFTAARARNEGFSRMVAADAERPKRTPIRYIQFVDGDCSIAPDWPATAAAFLDANPNVAIVCGRRRERAPDASVYNRLCDIEWAAVKPSGIGETTSSGGDFLIRREAFESVGGFNPALIAGEEPDLCYRLRREGWKIWRLDAEMTLHDAAMTRLDQWWRRTLRAGYAYANGYWMHGGGPERFRRREVLRAVLLGGVVPVMSLVGAVVIHPIFLLGFGVYVIQILRTFLKRDDLVQGRLAYAVACAGGRIPEFFGVAKFWWARLRGRQSTLIEYK